MNFWIITDTHFGHDMLWKYNHRPKDFEWNILTNLAKEVLPTDIVIHLGDFAFYKEDYWTQEFMKMIVGKKWLILGNHDKKSVTWYLEHGWDFVGNEIKLDKYGKEILFTHAPQFFREDFDINIHGHLHKNQHRKVDINDGKHVLLAMEDEYKPFNLRKIIEDLPEYNIENITNMIKGVVEGNVT